MSINVDNLDALDKFYGALTNTANSLGLSQLWLVGITKSHLHSIANTIDRDINLYEGYNHKWDIRGSLPEAYQQSWFLGDMYYLYAQSAVFPGDGISVSRQGSNQTGALKGLVGEQRNDLPTVTITFIETNQSVADILFRPWSIIAGFKSLKNDSIRIPIKLVCFQKNGPVDPLVVRKEINLVRAVPITIDSEEYNYTGDKVIYRQIEFVYDKYYVVAKNLALPIPNDGLYSNRAYKQVKQNQVPELGIDDLENDPLFTANIKKASNIDIGYQIDVDTGTQDKKNPVDSFLDSIENVIETAAGIYTTVQGKVDDVQAESVRILKSVGLDHAAGEVDEVFNRVQESVLQPIGDVIGTGIEVIGGIEAARRLGRDIGNVTDPNSGQVWNGEIKQPAANPNKPLIETPDKQLFNPPIVPLIESQNTSLLSADDFVNTVTKQQPIENQQNVTDDTLTKVNNSVQQTETNIIGTGEVVPNNISSTTHVQADVIIKPTLSAEEVLRGSQNLVQQPLIKPNVELLA